MTHPAVDIIDLASQDPAAFFPLQKIDLLTLVECAPNMFELIGEGPSNNKVKMLFSAENSSSATSTTVNNMISEDEISSFPSSDSIAACLQRGSELFPLNLDIYDLAQETIFFDLNIANININNNDYGCVATSPCYFYPVCNSISISNSNNNNGNFPSPTQAPPSPPALDSASSSPIALTPFSYTNNNNNNKSTTAATTTTTTTLYTSSPAPRTPTKVGYLPSPMSSPNGSPCPSPLPCPSSSSSQGGGESSGYHHRTHGSTHQPPNTILSMCPPRTMSQQSNNKTCASTWNFIQRAPSSTPPSTPPKKQSSSKANNNHNHNKQQQPYYTVHPPAPLTLAPAVRSAAAAAAGGGGAYEKNRGRNSINGDKNNEFVFSIKDHGDGDERGGAGMDYVGKIKRKSETHRKPYDRNCHKFQLCIGGSNGLN